MTPVLTALTALFVLIIAGACVWFLRHRWSRHRLTGWKRAKVLKKWSQAASQPDPHRRLLEADAILDEALALLGYQGSMADKLRGAHAFIFDVEQVWRAHKLRNRIAHEAGFTPTKQELETAVSSLGEAILRFCR
jgi:hypothetical protein